MDLNVPSDKGKGDGQTWGKCHQQAGSMDIGLSVPSRWPEVTYQWALVNATPEGIQSSCLKS